MSFLENDGDLILDAVITTAGRYRLAKGDGSFKIVKFALGDDEINYSLYDKNNPSGSAYYDLDILQTPILEAFTDPGASLKSKLISISRSNLLYLPVIKINDQFTNTKKHSTGAYVVAVDKNTEDLTLVVSNSPVDGIIAGQTGGAASKHFIRVDQGLDTLAINPNVPIDSDLLETQYIVEIDNRLGKIFSVNSDTGARVSYIDDDNIASYFFSLGSDIDYVKNNDVNNVNQTQATQVISGPRGTYLQFSIRASLDLNSSNFLFSQLGDTTSFSLSTGAGTVKYIDTNIRISGATTGYRIDIPVRFIKV